MRAITPIAGDERLLARGCYVYERDGARVEVTEPWTMHATPDGRRVLRALRDARAVSGVTIAVEAVSDGALEEASFERFEVRLDNERGGAVREARARYQVGDRRAVIERALDGATLAPEAIDLPEGTVASPLMRVFLGPTILAVAARGRGGGVTVLTPFLDDPTDASRVLGPVLDERSATLVGDEPIEIDGRAVSARCYRYVSRHYDRESRFWLDARGLLLRYRFRQKDGSVWAAQLTDSAA